MRPDIIRLIGLCGVVACLFWMAWILPDTPAQAAQKRDGGQLVLQSVLLVVALAMSVAPRTIAGWFEK